MSNILTPTAMWSNFDDSLDLSPETLSTAAYDGVKFESVSFYGRDTGEGRVKIFAVYACDENEPAAETVIILPDSRDTVDEELLKLFVKHGFSALMVDYRGEWEGCENYTRYPVNVGYANLRYCGRAKDFVDDSAEKTCWYEWVAVGIYARKYIIGRTGSETIAVFGVRDGGEISWKLGVACKFSCIVPVNAAGWKAYAGVSKYFPDEPEMDEERYRFIAGIDSQAYATCVKCPVLMLCSTGDYKFDYDRAYDTFSRINPKFQGDSVIAYSVQGNPCIDADCTTDMFMFLDKNLKKHFVFLPKPAELTVAADAEVNLVSRITYDEEGVAAKCSVYLAEDCLETALREWTACPQSGRGGEFLLNIYEKTTKIFVLASVKYTNGFTSWSKIAVKKISGRFRNMQPYSTVMFAGCGRYGGFSIYDTDRAAIGGIFLKEAACNPEVATTPKGLKGLYTEYGLTTTRMNSPRYAPVAGSVLKLDIYCEEDAVLTLKVDELSTGKAYECVVNIVGGVWQSVIAESKNFKTSAGAALPDFTGRIRLSLLCGLGFTVNNVMWL